MNDRLKKRELARHTTTFEEIAALTNAGIRDAMRLHCSDNRCPFDEEPINWGDLSTRVVRFVVDDGGHAYYEVVIEEASPNACDNFCLHIQRWLAERNYPDVEVTTEW